VYVEDVGLLRKRERGGGEDEDGAEAGWRPEGHGAGWTLRVGVGLVLPESAKVMSEMLAAKWLLCSS
jgi:hypothetical protein